MDRVPSPSLGRNTSPPRFPPTLVADIESRAARLGLKPNIFFSILIHNDLVQPVALKLRSGRAPREKEKRVPFPLSLPLNIQGCGVDRAFELGGTFTSYLEELAKRNIKEGGPLVVLEAEE